MRKFSWIVMPVIDNLDLTRAALADCMAQADVDQPRVLLIDNGSNKDTRRGLEAMTVGHNGGLPHMILPLWHHPPLGGAPFGALNASWNFGLQFCWSQGAEQVLVVNNDVRLAPETYWFLKYMMQGTGALFVSAVGVTEEQYKPSLEGHVLDPLARGGPDFSCFLISRACHKKYPFDENFTYYGDNDYHRHLKLGGDGDKIFGVNVPYLHYGSRTINRSPEVAAAYQAVFREHQERYVRKWGGLPGEEKWEKPYEGERFLRGQVSNKLFFGQNSPAAVAPSSVEDVPDAAALDPHLDEGL